MTVSRPFGLWRLSIIAAMTALMSSTLVAAQDANEPSFFPSRPAKTPLHSAQGILIRYGIGNKSGMFSLQDTAGKIQKFYIGYPMHLNGKEVLCTNPPTDRFTPDKTLCSDWPSNIRIGHTIVQVVYWDAVYNGQQVHVSDQLTNSLPMSLVSGPKLLPDHPY